MIHRIATLSLIALLAACSTAPAGSAPGGPAESTPRIASEAACTAQGGEWKQLGRAPLKQCLLRTSDAGKACTDGSQCEGLCLAADGVADGTQVGGTCSADTNVFGCSTRLRDGVASTLCVD